jgi:hypothetical protein
MRDSYWSKAQKKLVRAEKPTGQFSPSLSFASGAGVVQKSKRILVLGGGDWSVQDTQPEPCEAGRVVVNGEQGFRQIFTSLADEIGIQ